MISGKGILYTMLAASSAAILLGTMLTGGKRREPLKRFGSKVQNILGSLGRKTLPQSSQSTHRADMDQLSPTGHS